MFGDTTTRTVFGYDVEYDELVTRNAYVSAQISTKEFPQKVCYQISDDEFNDFPEVIKEVMTKAKESILSPQELTQYDEDYFFIEDVPYFNGETLPIKSQDGLEFLTKYDSFKLIKYPTNENIKKIEDSGYTFVCDLKYNDNQYRIEFGFDPLYSSSENFVFVNITKNDWGLPTIENPDISVYETFNATVIFQNNLDHDITLVRQNSDIIDSRSPFDHIVIPKQKSWSHMFRTWILEGCEPYNCPDTQFSYEIQPGNLIGKVNVNGVPGCITENEIRSLYSQVKVNPKFPLYLPEGYSFECGIHNTNWSVFLVYLNDEGRKIMKEKDEKVYQAAKTSIVESNGLIINYWDGFAANYWQEDTTYDKYEKQKDSSGFKGSKLLDVGGQPSVLFTEYYPDKISANTLSIFSDNSTTFTITGKFTDDELIKVGESLFQIGK